MISPVGKLKRRTARNKSAAQAKRRTVVAKRRTANANKGSKSSNKVAAERKQIIAAMQAKLNDRMAIRRQQWDDEDAGLRSLMAAASGGNFGPNLPSARQMAGGPAISARFDSAVTTGDNQAHWSMADGLAADAAANPMIRYTLRNRARYENANNCYAMGVGETIANDFCGTGPRLHIDDDRLSDADREDIEAKWVAWSNAIDLPGKLKTMRKARRVDGETFACKITNPNLNCPIKLDLRVIEADQVRFVDISLLLSPSVDGIRFDDYGNPVSYHILRIHPGYWSYATGYVGMPWEYDVWDARLVIHWFRQDRAGQHRGLPEILPALPLYATLRRYTQATLDAAETAADFAVLLTTESGASFVDADGVAVDAYTQAQAFSTMDLNRRMMMTLPAGYDAKQMQPLHPQQQYAAFKREICGEIGRCESVPTNVILADSSNSSFASGQLDHKIYFRTREIEREEANRLILDSLFADWIAEGVRVRDGNGDFGSPYLPQSLRALGSSVAHMWYWDSNEMGDPLKLAAAKSSELKDGITTLPGIYARKGQSWTKAFVRQARALGITVPELQKMIVNNIFPPGGHPAGDTGASDDGDATATVKPAQGAMQRN